MKKLLLMFLIVLPCLAQDSFQTFDGSTNGTAIGNTTIALGANGTGTGAWAGCSNLGSDFLHSQSFQMPFPGLQAAAGTKFAGGGTTGLQYTLRAASPFPTCSYSGITATNSVAAAFMFNANWDSTGDAGHQESNLSIFWGGGTEFMTLLHLNGLLKLETQGSGVSFTTAGVTFHGNQPVFVSMLYKVGSVYTMSVYDSTCTLIGTQQVSTAHPTNQPGLLIVGITGAEAEASGSGHAIGWDNIIVKEGATSEIACGDASLLSTGVLAPTRAYDWTTAGVTGGIPSSTWTQCGSTIAPYTGTAATINTAISACGVNQFVLLGSGTFNLSSQITVNKNNVALRGGGANSTFLVFTSGASGGKKITIPGSTSYTSFVEWTNGYAQGATKIKVASVPSGVVVGSLIRLDQCDDGTTADTCAGTSTDNGQLYNATTQYAAPNGASVNGPSGTQTFRWQQEKFIVTGISGTTITLQDPIAAPNWNPGQTPHAQFITAPLSKVGIENLSVDSSGLGASPTNEVSVSGAINSWVSGVRVINSQQFCLSNSDTDHVTLISNYCAFSQTASPAMHGISDANIGHALEVNNIIQGFPEAVHNEQAITSTVKAYNFVINMLNNTDLMGDGFRHHGDGGTFNLFEGNVTNRWWMDVNHGTNRVDTAYRNHFTSWESCANGQCGASVKDSATNAIQVDAFNRYDNIVANALGTNGFNNVYKSTAGSNKITVTLGTSSGVVPVDTLASSSAMLWGNYDVVTAAVRWCGNSSDTGWVTTCASTSEVPTAALLYANPVPTKGDTGAALPASFFLSSAPSWFGTNAFPAIGPDISSGTIGQCSGSLNVAGQFNGLPALNNVQCGSHGFTASAWGGHVNAIPAVTCALTVMGMSPDGTGSPLAFDATLCYSNPPLPVLNYTPSSVAFGQVPIGLTSNPITVTVTNSGASTLTATSISVINSQYTLINNTCGSPTTITTLIPGTGFTLAINASCTFQAIFSPTVGVSTGQVQIFDNTATSPDVLTLAATPTGPPAPATTMFARSF